VVIVVGLGWLASRPYRADDAYHAARIEDARVHAAVSRRSVTVRELDAVRSGYGRAMSRNPWEPRYMKSAVDYDLFAAELPGVAKTSRALDRLHDAQRISKRAVHLNGRDPILWVQYGN